AAVLRLDRTAAVSGRTSRTLRMGNLAPGIGPFPPVEKGPTSLGFADHPTAPFTLLPRNSQPLLGIARNGCSGSVGTTARDQSVRVLGINWNSCSGSLGAPTSIACINQTLTACTLHLPRSPRRMARLASCAWLAPVP